MNCTWLILILLLCGNNKKGDCSVPSCPCCDNDRPVMRPCGCDHDRPVVRPCCDNDRPIVKPCGCDCDDRPVVKPCGCDCDDRPAPEPRTTYPNYCKMNTPNTCGCEEN